MERRHTLDVDYRFKDEEGNTLTGYAARFGAWSEDLGFFKEKIRTRPLSSGKTTRVWASI